MHELKELVKEMMPKGKPVGYSTFRHDDRRTIEILHRNQLDKMDHDRRIQYDNLAHDFAVKLLPLSLDFLCLSHY